MYNFVVNLFGFCLWVLGFFIPVANPRDARKFFIKGYL